MIPMPQQPVQPALSQLHQLAQRFAHWRQHRPSPKARIPKELWDAAVSLTLTSHLSASRVATHLGLCTADLKKHYPASAPSPPKRHGDAPIPFVDVTPTTPWLTPTVEVDLTRTDGAHLHLAYQNGAPEVPGLVRAFLEPN